MYTRIDEKRATVRVSDVYVCVWKTRNRKSERKMGSESNKFILIAHHKLSWVKWKCDIKEKQTLSFKNFVNAVKRPMSQQNSNKIFTKKNYSIAGIGVDLKQINFKQTTSHCINVSSYLFMLKILRFTENSANELRFKSTEQGCLTNESSKFKLTLIAVLTKQVHATRLLNSTTITMKQIFCCKCEFEHHYKSKKQFMIVL